MTGRAVNQRHEPGFSLPAFERIAPAPPGSALAARIDAHTQPGDIVADLNGRGGWVARAALDRQRRAVSIETSPLTRMLAEVVLRPPDVRHLDAAFQGMAASPRRESSLKVSVGDLFATRCATCGRTLVLDEVTWSTEGAAADGKAVPISRHYRCTVCRDQRGGSEVREAPLDPDDLRRATADVGAAEARSWIRDRFPTVEGAPALVDELLDLHTDRQLVSLVAMIERIEGDLRAAPVLAALRLAFLHAILPTSRLAGAGGRAQALRISGGHVRLPSGDRFRERHPWLAFEESFKLVRGFVQRLEGGPLGPLQARLGEDLRALGEGSATAVLAVATPSAVRVLQSGAGVVDGRAAVGPRIRLVLGQPPVRPSLERLAAAYHGTAWVLGREAAGLLPAGALAEGSLRVPWSWQSVAIGRSLAAVEPSIARDGRVVQLVDGGPEAMAAVAIGAASAGYRLALARLADPDDDAPGIVELLPPGAALPPGPRTRANVGLAPVPGGSGDPDLVPGRGLFAPPERFDQRPFSATDAAKVVCDAAVETLRARGEPARFERLFGEILVGLDRSGQLRRLAAGWRQDQETGGTTTRPDAGVPESGAPATAAGLGTEARAEPESTAVGIDSEDDGDAPARRTATREAASDPVDRLLALIRDELSRPTQRRVVEIEPGRWWLGEAADREAAAPPLADRVEWAVFSLLSTAGPLSESAFFERIATMFTGHDLPDETLVRACLESYRSIASTSDRLQTGDDLLKRSQEHASLVGDLADAGHRLGMRVWISEREQKRRDPRNGGFLMDRLDERERHPYLSAISRAADDLAEVDAIWYIRSKIALLFEVEWTAILGEPLLRRHVRIGVDDKLLRFLVIAPERTDLVRYKLERSPVLRAALEDGGWHIIKSNHLRAFLAAERPDLDALEPLLGLDPVADRTGDQMPLFGE
ncbi:MAG: hypothetical protein ACSLFN_05920 [Candidatus Limnocylindrales bacterium]